MLERIKIVLLEPSHPGNIGAAARALKTMGLNRLVLVNPKTFPSKEAIFRAAGADDVLEQAEVVNTLQEALVDTNWVIGTSMRLRSETRKLYKPRACAEAIAKASDDHHVAIVFGRESTGLSNNELALCHDQVYIPANDVYSSLNLGAAVQVICYELRMAALEASQAAEQTMPKQEDDPLASADQVLGFYSHLKRALIEIGFMDPKQPKMLMERLQRLFNRAHLTVKELNILRGMLSAIEKYAKK